MFRSDRESEVSMPLIVRELLATLVVPFELHVTLPLHHLLARAVFGRYAWLNAILPCSRGWLEWSSQC